MTPIVLVTDQIRGIYADDLELHSAFAARGVEATFVPWDAPVDWARFKAAVIRTPWDYHERFAEFSAWLDRLDAAGVPLWNPSSLIRWNARKTYLLELASEGFPVIPTAQVSDDGLARHVERWREIVVKPEVGGGGAWTFRANEGSFRAVEAELAQAGDRKFLVQPFDPAVTRGEWSLVYFDGVFSHAVFKVARSGEFRIHEEHGGRILPAEADAGLRSVADRFATARGILPYARVDLLGEGASARLVELELIEPELFFRFSAGAPTRYADALVARLDMGTRTP